MPARDINVMALVKGGERYVFLYDDESRVEALRTLGRFASDPELSFTWHDAAVLGEKVRQAAAGSKTGEKASQVSHWRGNRPPSCRPPTEGRRRAS